MKQGESNQPCIRPMTSDAPYQHGQSHTRKRKSFVRIFFYLQTHLLFVSYAASRLLSVGYGRKLEEKRENERQTKWQLSLLSSKMILQFGVEASRGHNKEEEESNKHESRSKTRPKSNHHSQATFFSSSLQVFVESKLALRMISRP
jgi:hypothetical protein